MKKYDVVQNIFHHQIPAIHPREKGLAFAPTNIALCKYWGKRDEELNLPMTSSLSISLPNKGAMTSLKIHSKKQDVMILNGDEIPAKSNFVTRTMQFLDLFRPQKNWHLQIEINMNIPIAAGLASSASGFASLTCALNDLFNWKLNIQQLSILARLGSGSATRSLWNGFVEWNAGVQNDGMDSFGQPLKEEWEELCVGILSISNEEKSISSREAMKRTVNTSLLYHNWPQKVSQDMTLLKQAIKAKNFSLLGGTSESNALSMHATMLSSWPPVCYFLPETVASMHKIWELRRQGLEIYFTQDAGPNLKLLFQSQDKDSVLEQFPNIDVIKVFE